MKKWNDISQLWQLTSALFREITREPGVIFWGILFPILMTIGLGLAFTRKKEQIHKIAVIREEQKNMSPDTSQLALFLNNRCIARSPSDKGDWSHKLEIRDEKLGNSLFLFYPLSSGEAVTSLKRGTIALIIASDAGKIAYHFDPSNPEAGLAYLKLTRFTGNTPFTDIMNGDEIRPMTLTGTRYIDFLVPGLISMGVMMSCMWGISYGIIEKRSKKLLRRLVATPMKKSFFLISLVTVRMTMNFIEALILFIFALITFKMKIQGDIFALFILFLAGNIAFSGMAILASSHTANTEIGNGIINFVTYPMMILSGIFFSYQNFPDWSLPFIRYLPLTLLTDGIRSIFNEGAGFSQILVPVLVLFSVGVLLFSAALRIFKWH